VGWHEREAASLCVGGEGQRVKEWEGGTGKRGGEGGEGREERRGRWRGN